MSKNILLLETVADEAMQLLEAAENIQILKGFDETTLLHYISTERIDAIITRGKGQVRADLMDKLTHLRVISRCGVG